MQRDTEKQLINRFKELSARADKKGICTHTEFLSMAEQDILLSVFLPLAPKLFGGYEGAERRIAVFNAAEESAAGSFPIACLKISPLTHKFADKLCHRDVLGAVLNLGIERKVTGDIILKDNTAYILCLENIADFISENLSTVKRTSVSCQRSELPEDFFVPAAEKTLFVASKRADAFVSCVYNLGRSGAKDLFLSEKVFVNSRLVSNAGHQLKEGDTVSVRGFGRFVFLKTQKTTKKGNLAVSVNVY